MSIQILIGLKRLAVAKQRLMPQLSPAQRRSLMISMLTTVAAAARESGLGPVALATSEPEAPLLAAMLDVGVVSDGGLPWNEGLVHALHAVDGRARAVLYLAGDLPHVRAADLRAFADAAPGRGVAVARARDGGSNALLVRPSQLFTPMFGVPQSSEAHRAAAAGLGVVCRVVDIPGLALDVDTMEDVIDSGVLASVTETGPAQGRG